MVKEESGDDAIHPPWLHLLSAFLAMEPPDSLISISRDCGGGAITESVQNFIWDHCISRAQDGKGYAHYIRSFLKKVILEIESAGDVVTDELYEQFSFYLTALEGDDLAKGDSRIIRQISFLYSSDHVGAPACRSSRKLVVPLRCSLNMLEGDTGCSIWPSSLFLSEFILSCPELFSMKSCFELGSGVGLVGISLAHVKPSKVLLTDGDLSSLANLKVNLELNQLSTQVGTSESTFKDPYKIKCLHLPWESALESELRDLMPDIVLGADVIYDPQCIPHLVRVLATLLTTEKSNFLHRNTCQGSIVPGDISGKILVKNSNASNDQGDPVGTNILNSGYEEFLLASMTQPVAYIASVVRNIDTFNYFLTVAEQANLRVIDITQNVKMLRFFPYMLSYPRSSVRLLGIFHSCH